MPLKAFSIRQFALETGYAKDSVTKWLHGIEPDTGKEYSARQIIEAYVAYKLGHSDRLDAQQENAKLRRAQRERIEREEELAKGNTLLASDVREKWTDYITTCRAAILATPARCAEEAAVESDPNKVEDIFESALVETLEGLASDPG